MKPEHVEEFLERYESNPLEGLGITVNIRGRKKPLEGEPPENVRQMQAHQIVALSATYAPAVPFPPGTRITKLGVYFSSKAWADDYIARASFLPRDARALKIGKSWQVCNLFKNAPCRI